MPKMTVRRVHIALTALCLALFASAASAAGRHGGHHCAADEPAERRRRLAGRNLHERRCPNARPTTPGQFFTQAAGHPPVGFTQFIVKHEAPASCRRPSASSRTSGSISRWGSASTRRRPPSVTSRLQANAPGCPATAGRGPATITAVDRGYRPAAPVPGAGLQPCAAPRANRRSSASARSAATSSSKSDVEWSGDYHECFTIEVPESPLGSRSSRTALSSTASPATAPS